MVEIVAIFVVWLIVGMLTAITLKIINATEEDGILFLSIIWPISIPALLAALLVIGIVYILTLPIHWVIKK